MSKISKSVSKAKSAFDEKTVNNPTLSEQKIKAGKRKRESEPIFPRKKVRQELRVSKNRSIENRFTKSPLQKKTPGQHVLEDNLISLTVHKLIMSCK